MTKSYGKHFAGCSRTRTENNHMFSFVENQGGGGEGGTQKLGPTCMCHQSGYIFHPQNPWQGIQNKILQNRVKV